MSANPFSGATSVPPSVTVFKNPYHLSINRSKTQKKSKSGRYYASQKVHTARSYGSTKKTHTLKSKSITRKKSKNKKQMRVLSAKKSPTKSTSSSKYIKSPKSLGISPFSMKRNHHTSSTRKIQDKKPVVAQHRNDNIDNILSPLSSLMSQFNITTIEPESNFSDIQPKTKSTKKKSQQNQNYRLDLSPLSSILTKYSNKSSSKNSSSKDYRKKNYYHSEKHSYAKYSVSSKTQHKPTKTNNDGFHTKRHSSRSGKHTARKSARHANKSVKSLHTSRKHKTKKLKVEKTSMISMYNKHSNNNSGSMRKVHNSVSNTHNRSKSDPWNVGSLSLNDMKIKSMLGEGAFSKVYLVKFNQTKKVQNEINVQLQNKNLALKVIEKKTTSQSKQQNQSFEWERFALSQLSHPFIIEYYGSFFDDSKLCILTQFVIGGEILYHFENSRIGRFDNLTTQFYIGEIMCALEYLHSKRYVYRDLKPENILIDRQGHIKLVDFGFAKRLSKNENGMCQRTHTLCGSKEYVAPEVLTGNGHSFEADFWSLGVLAYEFAVGHLPFPTQECDPYQVLGIMQQTKVEFPNYVDKYCIDFIKKLLVFDPSKRLTSFSTLKNHIWFQSNYFNWQLCNTKRLKPPIMPHYSSTDDASNYATARFDVQPNQQDVDDLVHF